MTGSARFVVWVHHSARSIFGAASYPVNQNGVLLAFSDEQDASSRCDRLNARPGSSHVEYTVKKRVLNISDPRTCGQEDILDLTSDFSMMIWASRSV